MFSKVATTTLSSVARRHGSSAIARNGSKLNAPVRALSDVAASAPKQPIDVPPSAGQHWGHGKSYRPCNPQYGKRVVGKALAFGLVGYGGYWYGSKYGSPEHKRCPWNEQEKAVKRIEGKDSSEMKSESSDGQVERN